MTSMSSHYRASEVITARRTESLDAACIIKLVNSGTDALFGRINVVNLIEKAVLAVTLCNGDEDVLGHAAFFDYPNLPGVDPADWETWLNQTYNCNKCTAINTLFLHYFVAKPEYSHGCAAEIIRTVYNAIPELHYCYLVVPTGVYPEAALSSVFNELDHRSDVKALENCSIFVCHRHEHAPVLHVRPARVRDQDDLGPIFNRQSTMLQSMYGEYFLAELIEAQDDSMQCIVAEVDGAAIGFMSLTTEVDFDLLNDCFELGTFHGLRKPHDDDILKRPEVQVLVQDVLSRPASGESDISGGSKQSGDDAQIAPSLPPESTASSRAGSLRGEEVKTRPKLADEAADGTGSITTDRTDTESVKSLDEVLPPAQPPEPSPIEVSVSQPMLPTGVERFVPTYHGESSCFAIQLFVIDEKYEMRSVDFLPKAFDLFPDRDFCVISVPHLVPEFPLIQQFVRMTPRCPSALTQELSVFCRMGLHRDFRVRLAYESDTEAITNLVSELSLHETLLADLTTFHQYRRDPDGTQIQAFVAHVAGQVVGVAILRQEQDIELIRSHYNIEDFIYYNHHRRDEHGHLHHYALNPMFRHFSKHFLKEILRIGHKTSLYYPLYPSYVDTEILGRHSLIAALSELVPVRARRQIIYPLEELGKNGPYERVLKRVEPFALSHINRKLTLEPKVVINASIVVIGASDVSTSFLETFSFCPHLRFNNLTLISPHGLPGELPSNPIRNQMLATSHCYSQDDYARMSLRSWVNVVYGKMTAIDRKKKHVIVDDSAVVPYDHLIIATGLQYQVTTPTGTDITTGFTTADVEVSPDRRFVGLPPRNIFLVNDCFDAGMALNWVELNMFKSQGRILIYGADIQAFTSIQSFLTIGIPGRRIDLVMPPLAYEVNCFNDPDITEAVMSALTAAGISVYSDFVLAQWNDGGDVEEVTTASFTSSRKPLQLECQAFFCFHKKRVDYDAFKAINDACLVFDGRLVLDANFHTNDVAIRGAGPLTKFQRIYHSDMWSHANFNSKEVGIQLANAMLTLFDPTLEPESPPPRDLLKLIPMYRSPKIMGCFLPGEYYYLYVGRPKLQTPLEALRRQCDFGLEMVTGSVQGSQGYFRLHLNQYKSVEDITCLSKKPFPTSNLICLYNVHERFLNSVIYRYNNKLISDFYKFFQEKGLMAVYHDRYPDFREEVRELLVTRPEPNRESLEEKIRHMFEEDITLNAPQQRYLKEEFVASGTKRAVETRLLSFLSYNAYHLPMYAKPGMV